MIKLNSIEKSYRHGLSQTFVLRRVNADIKQGDAVLINTGHEDLWELGTFGYYIDPGVGGLAQPGIGLEVAQWLASRKVTTVGSDNS